MILLPIRILKSHVYSHKLIRALSNNVLGHVVIGGDDLSEYYSVRGLVFEFLKLRKMSKKISMILLGQSIGPFAPSRKKLASICLAKTAIYSRDDRTYEYCKKDLHLPYSYNSRDLAFLDLPYQNDKDKKDQLLSKYDIEENSYVTVVTSGLVKQYTQKRNDFISAFETIFDDLLTRDNVKKILLFPHVVRPVSSDDRPTNRDIMDYLKKKGRKDLLESVVLVEDEILPYEARILLGSGRFTITGRMHAAVSTLQMGKPAIALAYSVKYDGVLAKGLNIPELVIYARGTDKWTDGQIPRKVASCVDYVESRYEPLCAHIVSEVDKMKKIVEKQLDRVYGQLREGISR